MIYPSLQHPYQLLDISKTALMQIISFDSPPSNPIIRKTIYLLFLVWPKHGPGNICCKYLVTLHCVRCTTLLASWTKATIFGTSSTAVLFLLTNFVRHYESPIDTTHSLLSSLMWLANAWTGSGETCLYRALRTRCSWLVEPAAEIATILRSCSMLMISLTLWKTESSTSHAWNKLTFAADVK